MKRKIYSKNFKENSVRLMSDYDFSKGIHGSPRISKELSLSCKTVAKYMCIIGIKSKVSCKYIATIDSKHSLSVAENILNRDFVSQSLGLKCVSDITRTRDGFVYLTVILDLFDKKIIGYSLSDGMTAQETILSALSAQSFFKTIKTELVYQNNLISKFEMRIKIFEYIEIFYKKKKTFLSKFYEHGRS